VLKHYVAGISVVSVETLCSRNFPTNYATVKYYRWQHKELVAGRNRQFAGKNHDRYAEHEVRFHTHSKDCVMEVTGFLPLGRSHLVITFD
jgi:hypothetical protein